MPDPFPENPLRQTRAYVDLDALEHNLTVLAKRAPGSGLVPAVKADAYGHGIEAVSALCEQLGAVMLAVANLEECFLLRDRGINIPVLIFEDLFPEEIETALRAEAHLSVGSMDYARRLSETAARLGKTAILHVNADTGMGRIGLFGADQEKEILAIASLPNVRLEGLFSHFATSDEADKTFARKQIQRFQELLDALAENGVKPRFRHMANSGALIDFPRESSWDLVRPGIAMYGICPSREVDQAAGLKPVMRLESALIKITRYNRDWTIGYGRTYPVRAGSVIGIVPIGYGDGYPRSLSNRGKVLVRGTRVPVAGRVSMDMIAVDLTAVAAQVSTGDPVVLMGTQDGETIDAAELAALTDTIPYEITCGFTSRIPRIYLRKGCVVAVKSFRTGYQLRESL